MPLSIKSETARRNGAKSSGPIADEGKKRSSLNSLKHGLFAKQVVLSTEDPAEHVRLPDSYAAIFLPANAAEADLLEDLVNTLGPLRRVWQWQDALLELEMNSMHKEARLRYSQGLTNRQRQALALTNLAQEATEALHFFDRYESRFRRAYDRGLKNLISLQHLRNAEHLESLPGDVLDPERSAPASPPDSPPESDSVFRRIEPITAAAQPGISRLTRRLLQFLAFLFPILDPAETLWCSKKPKTLVLNSKNNRRRTRIAPALYPRFLLQPIADMEECS